MKNIKEMNTITALQLIERLKRIDPKAKIIMASDEEGNSYGTLNPLTMFEWINKKQKLLCIYPDEQFIDFDDDLL